MTPSHRRPSLDVLRGLTVAAMIVVNHPGNWLAVYRPLQHAPWNGWTLADLVFPFFIVIMGVAMAFAADDSSARAERQGAVGRVVRRVALLSAIGVLLNAAASYPDLSQLRLPGVLQRIALTYGGTVVVLGVTRPRTPLWVGAALLVLHWALLTLVPFGGMPAGLVSPEHNLAAWLDRTVFGAHLLAPGGDPEGLLGVLPSVATALIGVAAGRWLRHHDDRSGLVGLLVSAVVCVLIGAAWSLVWPMNKALWSGSFALFSSGVALMALALCDAAMAHRPALRLIARPFEWLGVNALAIYIGSELVGHLLERPVFALSQGWTSGKDIVFWRWIVPVIGDLGAHLSSVLYAGGYAVLWLAVAGLLCRFDVRLRV